MFDSVATFHMLDYRVDFFIESSKKPLQCGIWLKWKLGKSRWRIWPYLAERFNLWGHPERMFQVRGGSDQRGPSKAIFICSNNDVIGGWKIRIMRGRPLRIPPLQKSYLKVDVQDGEFLDCLHLVALHAWPHGWPRMDHQAAYDQGRGQVLFWKWQTSSHPRLPGYLHVLSLLNIKKALFCCPSVAWWIHM